MTDKLHLPLRVQLATYAAGFFSLSMTSMTSIAIPLWAVTIGASPLWIGIAVAARSFLPMLISVHGGKMVGRLGPRRVMIVLTAGGVILSPLFPLFPNVAALIVLQSLMGVCNIYGWIGAQAQINQLTGGHPTYTGRFTACTVAGTLTGPLVAGIAWEWGGEWAMFSAFGLWNIGLLTVSWLIPKEAGRAMVGGGSRPTAAELLPRIADYVAAYRLMLRPAVSFVICGTFLRNCVFGMRLSFYTVFLSQAVHLQATEIATLMTASAGVATCAALALRPALMILPERWILVLTLAIMVTGTGLTPLMDSFNGLLALGLFQGIGMGLNLSVILASLSRAAGPQEQGAIVGLRATANPMGAMLVPIIMGAAVEWAGLSAAFFWVGGGIAVLIAASWLLARRAQRAEATA